MGNKTGDSEYGRLQTRALGEVLVIPANESGICSLFTRLLIIIKYSIGVDYALYVRPSVCLSVYLFSHNSRTIRRRMTKLGTYTLEVKSNIELEDGSHT